MIALKCFTSEHNKLLQLVIEHHEMSTNELGGGGVGGGGVNQECFVFYLEDTEKLTQAKHEFVCSAVKE